MKRAKKYTRKLRTILGRVIRDIERKETRPDKDLKELLNIGTRILNQEHHDKNKVYSVHEPQAACISKGKAHKRYESGCKVSVVTTSRDCWFVGTKAFNGNPYDGHTLSATLKQFLSFTGQEPEHVFVDRGYRGHGYDGAALVHVDKIRRGRTSKSLWRWMKRRAALEPGIGHLKQHCGMNRNRLKGTDGDKVNAILSVAGMNFSKLLKWLDGLLRHFFTELFSVIRHPTSEIRHQTPDIRFFFFIFKMVTKLNITNDFFIR